MEDILDLFVPGGPNANAQGGNAQDGGGAAAQGGAGLQPAVTGGGQAAGGVQPPGAGNAKGVGGPPPAIPQALSAAGGQGLAPPAAPPSLLNKIVDLPGYLRYGMPTSQKEALAASGTLPGAPKDTSVYLDKANRYAAGYLFGKQWPRLSKAAMPVVDYIHGLAGDNPDLQSYADQGVNRGTQ